MKNKATLDSYVATCIESLQQYEIDQEAVIRPRSFAVMAEAVEAPTKGSIVGEGMLSFTGNLSVGNRADAQNAFLFATLVANKKYPNEEDGKEWYALFRQVMTDAGWAPVTKYYGDLHIGGTSARMDKLVLEILASVVANVAVPGPASALMLKVAGDAISALQKRDTALTIYERNLLENGVGGIAAGSCTEVNGEVLMAVGAVRFKRRNTSTKVLFVDVDVRNVKLYRGETLFAKNEFVADEVRQTIKDRLSGNVKKKIEDYDF
ncbi:hypothetical protein [Pseudomonas sp.]|uniref:hypothetical protein n=1 Tax=Pseudomonas sp. TaxID=306 RepID=UPI002E334418|nr:hypothetical protein [Pseudomonas sp.]HEX4551319.1 hypothetical protein [Pseudomonas sp.]